MRSAENGFSPQAEAAILHSPRQGRGERKTWLVFSLLLLAWAFLHYQLLRPNSLAADWNGWRQADTQSMALGFLESAGDPFHPRVFWGGDGPGFVESEFALYPYCISLIMRLTGPREDVAQLFSIVLVGCSIVTLFAQARRRLGNLAAATAALAFASSQSLLYLTTSVQPEPLSMLLALLALGSYLRWCETPERWSWLVPYTVLASLACLVKPTTIQVLIAAVVVMVSDGRTRRHWKAVALVHSIIVCMGIAYLLHARHLYLDYGNTFGLLSGGDRKTPLPEHLRHPRIFLSALWIFLRWGLGIGGAVALVIVGIRKRVNALLVALSVAAAVWAVISLRYSSSIGLGSHYTMFGAVLAGWGAAFAVDALATCTLGTRSVGLSVLGIAIVAQGLVSIFPRYASARREPNLDPAYAAGVALRRVAKPKDLVVVHSRDVEYDDYWKTPNNYEDPCVFYVSDTRGWTVPSGFSDPDRLQQLRERGADFFVDPVRLPPESPVGSWLLSHGKIVARTAQGDIWQLM